MMQLLPIPMLLENRRERFTEYTTILREPFASGILAELRPLNQLVVGRGEVEDEKNMKVPYNSRFRNAEEIMIGFYH